MLVGLVLGMCVCVCEYVQARWLVGVHSALWNKSAKAKKKKKKNLKWFELFKNFTLSGDRWNAIDR